jgi:multidrug transporter EmrE-like cation transporter
MSLKAFHIVFVCISTLLFAFLAVWAFAFATDRTATITALGTAGAIGALVMPVYGVFFYRKVRNIVI